MKRALLVAVLLAGGIAIATPTRQSTLPPFDPTWVGYAPLISSTGVVAWSSLPSALPPTGTASGDLSGSYPSPTVAGLKGGALPSSVANGFVKRNAGNTAWEEVAYGTASDTVCQGNDSRLSDNRAPTGTASGDLSGAYPAPSVVGLNGQAIQVAADGFVKRNSGNTAWEAVGYGASADTVCQGNDSRVVNALDKRGDTMIGTLTAASGITVATGNITFSQSGQKVMMSSNGTLAVDFSGSAGGCVKFDTTVGGGYCKTTFASPASFTEFDAPVHLLSDVQFTNGNNTITRNSNDQLVFHFSGTTDPAWELHGYWTDNGSDPAQIRLYNTGGYSRLTLPGGLGFGAPNTQTPSGTTATLSSNKGTMMKLDLSSATGTVTVTLANPALGERLKIRVVEGGTARQVTWPASFKWPGGTAPTFASSTTNKVECDYYSDTADYLCRFDLDVR